MQRVNIEHLAHRQIGELSGGQKNACFGPRFSTTKSNYFIDEPFTGVDVKTENAIVDLLQQLREEGHLILVSTHNLGSVPDFCDQVVMINRTVIAAGKQKTPLTNIIWKLYLVGCCVILNYWAKIYIMMKINVLLPS